MTIEAIEEKIRKLLALAANNPSKEESASALAKAQALMTEYKIEQASLDVENSAEEKEIETIFGKAEGITAQNWKYSLAGHIARANGCFMYTQRGTGSIGIVGKPNNVRSCRYLLMYCVNEVERIAKANCAGLGRAYIISFKFGCVQAIAQAITLEKQKLEAELKAKAAASNDSRGLIVLNNAITKINAESKQAEAYAKTKHKFVSSRGGSISSNSGYSHGQQAGSSIYPGSRAKIGNSSQGRLN